MPSDFNQAVDALVAGDADLAGVIARWGRPAPFSRPATFQTLILLILEQQVSLDSARAAYNRLAAAIPGVEPSDLLRMSDGELRACGFSRQKARYGRALATLVTEAVIDPTSLHDLADDEVRRILVQVPGIGPWTADVFLMASLGRTDIWPIADRALQVATSEALALSAVPTQLELADIGERWRPYRTAAAHILWHGYLRSRGRSVPAQPDNLPP